MHGLMEHQRSLSGPVDVARDSTRTGRATGARLLPWGSVLCPDWRGTWRWMEGKASFLCM